MNRTIIKGALATAVLGGTGLALALSGTAEAASPARTIVASDHVAGVPDTTVGTTATNAWEDANGQVTHTASESAFGPVWAIDDFTNTFRVTPLGNNDYKVDRLVNGTFEGWVQPNTNSSTVMPLDDVHGSLHGTNSYQVHSLNAPDASKLLAEQATATGTHAQLRQLFPGLAEEDISGGNTWVFAYSTNSTGGSRMVQRYDTTPDTWGNITG
jgi:hypothetical protein